MSEEMGFDDQGRPVPVTHFDYGAVDRDEATPTQPELKLTSEALRNSLEWLCSDKARAYFSASIHRDLITLAWVVTPEAYQGKSLARLAAELGISKQALSRRAARAARVFGIRNRSQRIHGFRWRGQLPR